MEAQIKRESPAVEPALQLLKGFVPVSQLAALRELLKGEEGDCFAGMLVELAATIQTMPKTYEQDGKGLDSVVHLHYFMGGMDWHITELDSDPDGEGQVQAFGQADLGYGPELGYISIEELLQVRGMQLDLHWKPRTLADVRGRK